MTQVDGIGKRTLGKVKSRFLPFIFLIYLVAYLDRVNIGYAALDMNNALGISSASFGLLASIFFVGYATFGIPSNIMLHRFGARKWIAGILVFWGIVATGTTWAQSVEQLYFVRFMLGVAEAGFFPGAIYFMTCWFPEEERAKAFAWLLIGIPVANIVGSPLSTWIMDHVSWLGMPGWRWLFFMEGIPAIICAFATLFILTGRPEEAKWLSAEEKTWLIDKLREEELANQNKVKAKQYTIMQVFGIGQVWRLSFIYFTYVIGGIAITLWMPQIIKEFSQLLTNTQVGLIVMVPYIIAAIAMWYWSWDSDRTGERRMHTAIPSAIAVVGLAITLLADTTVAKMLGIMIALVGSYASYAPFWALPALFLSEEAAAVGIAMINSFAQIGGFSGSYVVGYLKGAYGMNAVFFFLCMCFVVCFLLTVTMSKKDTTAGNVSAAEK
jgi:Sugar phosphate permease